MTTTPSTPNTPGRDRAFVPFVLPDTIDALPHRPFEFSRAGWDDAAAATRAEPDALFRRLLRDQESESSLLIARRVIDAFVRETDVGPSDAEADAEAIAAHVLGARAESAAVIDALTRLEPEPRESVLRQRAPLGLLAGCWLDTVSQPATQPSVVVNRLFAQHLTLRGGGNAEHGQARRRRRALADAGVHLPEIAAADFLDRAQARPLTALHGCFYLALSRLPANFLPEVSGVHYTFHALGTDDLLSGTPPLLSEPALREVLAEHLALAGPSARRRLYAAVRLTLELEREHLAMLTELGAWRGALTPESKVARIIARHAPLAGRQHGGTRVGGRLLSDVFGAPRIDLAGFLADLRESGHLRGPGDGSCRLVDAMRFGGPMFGIFDEREAATIRAWAASVQAGERPRIEISNITAGDEPADRRRAAIARSAPADVVVAEAEPRDQRELFHRLVNVENFANILPVAAERAQRCFEEAEILFVHGAGGRYTDATWFEYSPQALYERAERVYWEKLVDPYEPLREIPDRDEVIFRQSTYYLTYLIDGAWLHRLGNLGRERESDGMLFAIYADEMGNGDLCKNHITLTHRVLASAGIELPHIRDEAFVEQDELPDDLYGFAIQQLCMCLFPDRFHNEILGYNLAIEMFGSGEMRLHEIQKLRHHDIDTCYEQAHLTIDNFSAGHAKQAAEIIVGYLDHVRRTVGEAAVAVEWRRVWRGYASFAYFLEQPLLKGISAGEPAAGPTAPSPGPADDTVAELVI
ncbi:iron-containing redox enzyme family protein [Embleya sp. NBC_00896]|uniref:iron-containing redox enzyme family protein n=1 Tax=Embleya sp. NBC_00896 TaxID=2975961 RepID=UPI002F91312E|nr:iron-containing redox enzyme family protein [Embleya sp. NBC_00896]